MKNEKITLASKVKNSVYFIYCFICVLLTELVLTSGIFGDEEDEGAEEVGQLYGKDKIPQRKDEKQEDKKEKKGDGSGSKESKNSDDKGKTGSDDEDEEAGEEEQTTIEITDSEGKKVYDFDKVFEKAKSYYDDIDLDKLSPEKKAEYIKKYIETAEFMEIKEQMTVKPGEKKESEGKEIVNPVKIAGQVYSYDEIFDKAKEYFSDIDFGKLSEEKKARYVKDYINSANFKEAEKSFHRKFQDLKMQRDEVERKQKELDDKLEEARGKLEESDTILKKIKKQKEDLQKIVDTNIDDIIDDDEKRDKELDIRDAKKDIKKLEELEKKEQKTYENIIIQSWIDELQSIPGLETKRHVHDILNSSKSSAARKNLEPQEIQIAEGIARVLNDYNSYLTENPDADISIVEYYHDRKYKYPELTTASTGGNGGGKEDDDIPDLQKLKAKEMLDRLLEKQKNYKPFPSSSKTTSIEKSGGKDDENPEKLKEDLGYGTGGSAGHHHRKSE